MVICLSVVRRQRLPNRFPGLLHRQRDHQKASSCSEAPNFVAKYRVEVVRIHTDALARAQVQGELLTDRASTDMAEYLFICYNGFQAILSAQNERAALVRAV